MCKTALIDFFQKYRSEMLPCVAKIWNCVPSDFRFWSHTAIFLRNIPKLNEQFNSGLLIRNVTRWPKFEIRSYIVLLFKKKKWPFWWPFSKFYSYYLLLFNSNFGHFFFQILCNFFFKFWCNFFSAKQKKNHLIIYFFNPFFASRPGSNFFCFCTDNIISGISEFRHNFFLIHFCGGRPRSKMTAMKKHNFLDVVARSECPRKKSYCHDFIKIDDVRGPYGKLGEMGKPPT